MRVRNESVVCPALEGRRRRPNKALMVALLPLLMLQKASGLFINDDKNSQLKIKYYMLVVREYYVCDSLKMILYLLSMGQIHTYIYI